jgi:hypothetical protein
MRANRWSSVGAVLAVVVCSMLGPRAGAASAGALPEGQLWAERPRLPWDEEAVTKGQWAKCLDAKLDLSRRGKVGETRRYRIHRENMMYDPIGRPASRMVADGTIERVLLRETEPGRWTERFTWTQFAAGQGQGPTEAPVPQEVAGAAQLSYEFSPKTFGYVNIPADFSGIQDPVAAYLIKVVAMDLSGFDALANTLRTAPDEPVQIGMTKVEPRWQQGIDITQATSKDTAGRYRLGEMTVSVMGITRRNGEPCALIWFGAEGNDVSHDFSAGPMAMSFHGTEHFWGEMAVSLEDGHIVGGELRGPLPWVMKMGMNGEEPKQMPVAGVIQQVSLWEIPAEAAK